MKTMKIFNADQLQRADAYTIAHEPITSIDLMERASQAFVDRFVEEIESDLPLVVVAGMGNNGGDGLAIARMLAQREYGVQVNIVKGEGEGSADFQTNLARLPKEVSVHYIRTEEEIPDWPAPSVIIDALFGTGLSRSVMGIYSRVILAINRARAVVVAVDMPSGLFTDSPATGPVVEADWVLTFELPKLSFFMPSHAPYASNWEVLPIGISRKFIDKEPSQYGIITWERVEALLKSRPKFSHKSDFGRVLLIAGSKGMMGAAVLASRAALRTGTGLLTTAIPACGYTVLQTAVPEAMVLTDAHEDYISSIPSVDKFDAIGAGPGLGRSTDTMAAVKALLKIQDKPLVLDADALNLIAMNPRLLEQIPKGSILTPHPGEFDRLAGTAADDVDRLRQLREMAENSAIYIVLKGAHTAIATPEGKIWYNITGNPGMATAGSGDVLTGIITSLLGQRYGVEEACQIGVFLHGLAGDLAAGEMGMDGMVATDIVRHIPAAWQALRDEE
jgi:ADP-dependent NAD(P)H-hydrate dehydratase / NAD(P)H-hydrate epimerase